VFLCAALSGIDCQEADGPDCVTTSRSHRFRATFEDVFNQPAFDNFPFYVILGNASLSRAVHQSWHSARSLTAVRARCAARPLR
jgi:hypothetical protein